VSIDLRFATEIADECRAEAARIGDRRCTGTTTNGFLSQSCVALCVCGWDRMDRGGQLLRRAEAMLRAQAEEVARLQREITAARSAIDLANGELLGRSTCAADMR
jgi:hypothetical protein